MEEKEMETTTKVPVKSGIVIFIFTLLIVNRAYFVCYTVPTKFAIDNYKDGMKISQLVASADWLYGYDYPYEMKQIKEKYSELQNANSLTEIESISLEIYEQIRNLQNSTSVTNPKTDNDNAAYF